MNNNIIPATPESAWAAIRALAVQQAETDRILTEKFAATDRILSEKFAATDRILSEKFAELKESQAETDRLIKATDRQIAANAEQMAKTDRKIEKIGDMVGGLSNNTGLFAEEYFYQSIDRGEKVLMGEKFDKLIKSKIMEDDENNKTKGELDMILINGKCLIIIEVKFRVRDKHVDNVKKKIKPFRERFPEYKNHKIYLGLASMVFDDEIADKCMNNGIAVIRQVGGNVEIYGENLKTF